MEPGEFSDEILMAYADGELDAATAQAVAAEEARDPAIAARIGLFRQSRAALAGLAAARPAEPVPAALMDRVRETLEAARAGAAEAEAEAPNVVAFRRPAGPAWVPTALAASIALAVGLSAGLLAARNGDGGGPRLASLEAPGIDTALDAVAAGERIALEGGELSVIASFENAGGEFCREFEYSADAGATLVSVVCRGDAGWDTRFAVVAEAADDTGYAPASSLDALEAYLGAVGAGAPLSPDAEAAALERIR